MGFERKIHTLTLNQQELLTFYCEFVNFVLKYGKE
mgnify:CR=1 FL=1